jgi:hypothetical protein
MVEIRLSGSPTFLLKIRDTADEGVGIVVRPDSGLLEMVEVGQELEFRLNSPTDDVCKRPSGPYRSNIEHITEIRKGPFKGHVLVGLAILNETPAEN